MFLYKKRHVEQEKIAFDVCRVFLKRIGEREG